MKKIFVLVCFGLSALFFSSLIFPQVAAPLELYGRGYFDASIRDVGENKAIGYFTIRSVWRSDKLVGHILKDGSYQALDPSASAGEGVLRFEVRIVVAIVLFVAGAALLGPSNRKG
jgi:hypothetical protein